MSTLDGELPGHDDLDDSDDMDFVRDLMDKFQAVEDAGHRLAKHAALRMLANEGRYDVVNGVREITINATRKGFWFSLTDEQVTDAILYLTERCGATYDAETRTLRMPKE